MRRIDRAHVPTLRKVPDGHQLPLPRRLILRAGGKIKIFAATESSDGSVRAFHNHPNTGENNGLFDFISLRSNDGTEKQAYDYLRALRSL